jgi:hypothetical protein
VYHSAFGDLDESATLARRLLRIASARDPVTAADIYRKSGIALSRAGYLDEAISAFREAVTFAKVAGLRRIHLSMTMAIATSYCDLGNDDCLEHWLGIADELAREDPEFAADHISTLADIALARGETGRARQYWRSVEANLAGHTDSRAGRWLRAVDHAIRQTQGEVFEPQPLVHSMIGSHRRNGEIGDESDIEVGVAIRCLAQHDQLPKAKELLSQYLREYRRRRGPLNRWLQSQVSAVGAEDIVKDNSWVKVHGRAGGEQGRPDDSD